MRTNPPRALSHGAPLELTDDDPRDAVEALVRAAEGFPGSGVRTPGGLLTYARLLARARRLLTGLREAGLEAGHHVVLHGLPPEDFFPAFWACVLGGVVPVAITEPASSGAALDRVRGTWRLLDEPLVLTDAAGAAALRRLGGPPGVDIARWEDGPPAADLHRPDETDVALLILSSGSTGTPKAARLTHRALAEFAAGTRREMDLRPGDVTLNWLPVDHSGAFLLYHVLPVFTGCTNVHLPTGSVVADPLSWLDELAEHRVNHCWSPTFGLQLVADELARAPDRSWDLSAIRTLFCGGEQVLVPVVRRFLDATAAFGVRPEALMPVWGMAETTTAITLGRWTSPGSVRHVARSSLRGELRWVEPDDPDGTAFVAVGRPAPGAALRVVDAEGEVLPERWIGALQVRSNRVTAGYANNAAATGAALPDGTWLRTGDLAFLVDGELVITGREQDVIVLNGQNVPAHEVEEVAGAVDGVPVGGVGARGIPNPSTGTDDLVVFFEAVAPDPDEVGRRIREAVFTRLRLTAARVVAVPAGEFPRTPSGKVRRAALRDRPDVPDAVGAEERVGAPVASAVVVEQSTVAAVVADPAGRVPEEVESAPRSVDVAAVVRDAVGADADPHTPFYELGLTSVHLLQLRKRVEERLGTPVATTAVFEHPTVAALTAHLVGRLSEDVEPAPRPPALPADGGPDNRIAIVGMAARFPDAPDVDRFWANLRDGVDSVRVFGPAADPAVVPVGGVLADVDSFDADFFGVSPREAAFTEPAHRLFLECAHQALEHGGYAGPARPGTRIGVYAGTGMNLYGHQDRMDPEATAVADVPSAMQATIGGEPDFLATRVAYRLGLTGPAIGVQTACSTSLVAVHLAVQALLSGDADLALAGAAAVRTPQDSGYRHFPGSILSPTGRCRTFDADADGTVGGNGVAAVLLKRLDRALADGDTVHAVILGTAVNNDGTAKAGFTAPSVSGQAAVIRQALARAGVDAGTVSYVEAHGTGTPVGDPIEFEALSQAFASARTGSCALGSVKPNIGHLDSCAGMAGLIKTVLMLEHRELVPTINLSRPNPALRLDGSPFVLATERRPWTTDGTPRRAGVSALGVGGTNAHVVLEEAPPVRPTPDTGGAVVVPLSARDPRALAETAERLRAHLVAHPDLAAADVATTMALGRRHLPLRAAVVGRTTADLVRALSETPRAGGGGPLVFAFSGQGGPVAESAERLRREFPVTAPLLDAYTGPLLQPRLFVYQAALVELWRSFGVRPDTVLGHSAGELAALHAAGVLSFEDGVRLTSVRGELMQSTEPGAMIAVATEPAVAREVARDSGTELAAVNGPLSQVLSGDLPAIERAKALLERRQVSWRVLDVDRAFHSALLDPVLPEYRRHAEKVDLRPPRIPVVNGLDGTILSTVDADHLGRHARLPVRFDLALARVGDAALVVEIGPGDVLTRLGRRTSPGSRWAPSQGTPDALPLAVAEAYRGGADVDWTALAPGGRVPLPGYPLERRPVARPDVKPAPSADGGTADAVRALTARHLGTDPATVDQDRSFLEMGADSLVLMAMVRELDQGFGVRVPMRDLFEGTDTPRKLAALLGPRTPVAAVEPPAPPPPPAPVVVEPERHEGARSVVDQQLDLARHMVDQVTTLMARQLEFLGGDGPTSAPPLPERPRPEPRPETRPEPRPTSPLGPYDAPYPASGAAVDFSLYFFGDYPDQAGHDKYRLITDAAVFADDHDFHAVWLPERHFHSFGSLFPNPSVLAAALAGRTSRIRLHAGSVVLPLHHPIRVAEEWSVVDNLSGGRIGLCFASGWHSRDFALAPENYGRHREEVYTRLDTVRRLWSGESVEVTGGDGDPVDVRLYPGPVQPRPPMSIAVVGNPDSYRRAATEGLGVVTNLMSQTVEELAANIALYRRTREEAGLDPAAGRVVVLVHTYLGDDLDAVRAEAFEPFCGYLRSSLSLFGQVTNSLGVRIDLDNTAPEDVDFLLEQAYQRYCESRALIGTLDSSEKVMAGLLAAGVDEIASFVDFGVPADRVLAGLPALDALRRRYSGGDRALSAAERRIWFLERLHPGTSTYNEPKAIRFDGVLDPDALRGALRRVVERQPALRTVFREVDGEPRAVVLDRVDVDVPVVDVAGADQAEALDEVLRTTGREVFDLAEGPLLRATLLRFAADHHVLFLVAHHIVFDSPSTVVVTRELAAHYRAWPRQPVLPVVAVPEVGGATDPEADLRYWSDLLRDAPELRLPTDRPRPAVRTGAGASAVHELDAELTERVRRFGQEQRATVFTVLLGAFAVVLSRFSGQDDFVLGTGVAGRPPGAQDTVGMFVDTVPLRLDLSGDQGFAEFARALSLSTMESYEHRGVPFDQLVRELNPRRDPHRNPLFQVAVEYEHEGSVEFAPPNVAATLVDLPSERAPLDLVLYLTRRADGVGCIVEFDTDLFDRATVDRLLAYFDHVVRLAVEGVRLSELDGLVEGDRLLLESWQGAEVEDSPLCLHQVVEAQADRVPDAVALTGHDGELTYRELDERANGIAHRLIASGVGRGDLVGVHLPRGRALVAAVLGVLKAGAAFVPLDPSLPPRRLRFMADDAAVALVVTDRGRPVVEGPPSLLVEDVDPSAERPDRGVGPDDLAYCLYTSGSTGRPKGVLVPHRGPVNLVRWHLAERPPTRTLQWASPAFDGSVYEVFTTLASGAALVLMPDETRYDPAAVADVVRQHGVERFTMPFTALRHLLETRPVLPSLREVVSAGEALVVSDAVRDFLAGHPDCALHNFYGPTEASIGVTTCRVDPSETHPPIGRPVQGVRVELVDARGRPVPVGAIGEIQLGGVCVADGYLRRPEETAAAFVAPGRYRTGDLARWRAGGTLEFHGRVDEQVKIRGLRIEPAEVRHVLSGLPGVREAAVLVRDGELVAYVAGDADPAALTDLLGERLPSYLVPRRWVLVDRLPVTANGKLDEAELPPPGTGEARESAPTTPAERVLHELWCAELDRREIGLDESFFELGGHSLTVVRLLNRVRDRVGAECSMTEFFRDPTIRGMAARLDVEGTAPLTSAQRRLRRRHHAHANPAIYAGLSRVDIGGDLDPALLRGALDELTRRHSALRTRIRDDRQEVLRPFPVDLAVTELAEADVDRWCLDLAERAFDLGTAPLWRVGLARIGERRWVLAVVVHHMVFDGWSASVFWNELSALYAGAELPPPSAQYPDHARAEQEALRDRRALESFWRTELAGATLRSPLPTDRPRPAVLSGAGATVRTSASAADLRSAAAGAGTTPHVVIARGFADWLAARSGQPDVVLAVSSSRRTRSEHETMIGYVGEAVLVRTRPGDDLAERLYAALDHQALPLSEVVRAAIPHEADDPYPAVLFTVVAEPPVDVRLGGATGRIRGQVVPGLARTELYVVFTLDGDVLALDVEYSTDLYDDSTASRWAAEIMAAVEAVTARR
ncbi:non-ribosomal peptide synthetase/type I polyketide synthase [Umezawaea sp.]|uniref:non-ribosomal peptide synthetase/type I polyketide synthase n=1 Tax=Umezawaea sp. TaxID=1955258 RepID=UPI002ED18652